MMKKETNIQAEIMMKLSDKGCRVFRNNCGTHKTEDGRFIKYGVGNPGGSDLIGWTSVTVTPEMVGKPIAIFTAVEVKTPSGRTTAYQSNFISAVLNAGGIAGIARSPQEALDLLPKP